jgi:toxin-antitoxin system PIN domain toxin
MVGRKRAESVGVREPHARHVVTPAPAAKVAGKSPLRPALLDVNVLIALLDANHVHHARAGQWLTDNLSAGWASCALTENGCVRIMSQPGYPNTLPAARVAQRLREATETGFHRFVPDDMSLLDVGRFDAEQLLGHRQVTDAYLLGLAVAHQLRLVTFDERMPTRVVRGADASHVVVL